MCAGGVPPGVVRWCSSRGRVSRGGCKLALRSLLAHAATGHARGACCMQGEDPLRVWSTALSICTCFTTILSGQLVGTDDRCCLEHLRSHFALYLPLLPISLWQSRLRMQLSQRLALGAPVMAGTGNWYICVLMSHSIVSRSYRMSISPNSCKLFQASIVH